MIGKGLIEKLDSRFAELRGLLVEMLAELRAIREAINQSRG